MKSHTRLAVLATIALLTVMLAPSVAVAALHGAAATKQTTSPVKVGDPYTSRSQFLNVVDEGEDTLRVTGLSDVVFASGGNDSSGDILAGTKLFFDDTLVTCTGGSGNGVTGYLGATSCLVEFGGTITTDFFSHYTVVAGDFQLDSDPSNPPDPDHMLADTVTWNWNNTCVSDPDQDCSTEPQTQTAGSSALVLLLESNTTTNIHNAAHQTVTTVLKGTTVHDWAKVTGAENSPIPTGDVIFKWYSGTLGNECTNLLSTSSAFALDASGEVDATTFTKTPNTTGFFGFRAFYQGDDLYAPSDGACEPLRVVDARISVTPNGTNEVGTAHTFTFLVESDNGSGTFAPVNNVTVTASTNLGTFSPGNQCTTNASGLCTLALNSANPGLATVQASATVPVSGINVSVATDGYGAFTVQNQKLFADANISITPNGTNEVGNNHTFTVTVMKNIGNGMVAAAGEHVTVSLANSNGATGTLNAASSTCDNAGANTDANGKCLLVISSPTTGQTVANAAVTLTINGPGGTSTQLTRDTSPATATIGSGPGGSGPATKTWVDANITVTPQTAVNPTGTNHTFTITVKKDLGNGAGLVPAAGETVTFNGTGVGNKVSDTCGAPTNASGQCQVVWTSNVGGQTKLFAAVTLTITTATGSDTLTRDANSTTTGVGHGPGGTDEALKTWNAPTPTMPDTAVVLPGQDTPGNTSSGMGLMMFLILGTIVAVFLVLGARLRRPEMAEGAVEPRRRWGR
jgi:hypothetical protein